MRVFLQLLVEGVEQGSIFALWAVAYGLVYQILGLLNFAFGAVLLFGTYFLIGIVASTGMSPWLALLPALCLAGLMSMIVERQVYARFVGRRNLEGGFIAALACAYIIEDVATAIWGHNPLAFPTLFSNHIFNFLGLKFSSDGLMVLGIVAAVVLCLAGFLRFTKLGRGILLSGQDREAAAIVGVPVRRIVTVVYGVSGLLGLIGAVLYVNLNGGVDPTIGFFIVFQAFIAATVGGVGSLGGCLVGGLALGVVEAIAVGYVTGAFAQALAWTAMALVVLIRPRGFLGRVETQRV